MQLGWWRAADGSVPAGSLQSLHPVCLPEEPMTLCHCTHTLGFPELCVSLGDLFYVCVVGLSSHLCT